MNLSRNAFFIAVVAGVLLLVLNAWAQANDPRQKLEAYVAAHKMDRQTTEANSYAATIVDVTPDLLDDDLRTHNVQAWLDETESLVAIIANPLVSTETRVAAANIRARYPDQQMLDSLGRR